MRLSPAIVVAVAAISAAIGWDGAAQCGHGRRRLLTRFTVDSQSSGQPAAPTLTPDGRVLVFATDRLYKRDLAAFYGQHPYQAQKGRPRR